MTLPSWENKKYGSMARAALWLETEVGEGQIFTKTELRRAFPEVAQIDRRMRDLRAQGWQIDTHREDPQLRQEEQRYTRKGAEVWLPGQVKTKPKTSLSAAQRTRIMQSDNFLCRSCGIGAGEPYADGQGDAQLDIARREVLLEDGTLSIHPVTECNRCRVGGRGRQENIGGLLEEIRALTILERRVLAGWIETDQRRPGALETVWGRFRVLPAESRDIVAKAVENEE